MTAPTKAQIERARAIADRLIPDPENESVVYRSFHQTAERAALAAIIETQETAERQIAEWLQSIDGGPMLGHAPSVLAAAIRDGSYREGA